MRQASTRLMHVNSLTRNDEGYFTMQNGEINNDQDRNQIKLHLETCGDAMTLQKI